MRHGACQTGCDPAKSRIQPVSARACAKAACYAVLALPMTAGEFKSASAFRALSGPLVAIALAVLMAVSLTVALPMA